MSLLDHAIWWHVYPLGALGAPVHDRDGEAGVVHRLPRLEAWLDHAVALGCSGLLLGPVFDSTGHGYDTLDHLRIDPRLGDDADFDHLVAAARGRGLSVLLDGVFNHVGAGHPLVAASVATGHGPVRLGPGDGSARPLPWEGHGDLALLDHGDPAVADLVVEVMLHWLRRGIAGWRLDVAYAVPADFWRGVTGRVRAEFPDAVFVGEVIHGDYAGFARDAGLDSVTQYELWKGVWSSIHDANLWELAWALERHDAISRELVAQTFVGNHDVTRIAERVGDAGAALAAAVLMTVPGSPSLYYGDEHAFRGAKGTGRHADDPLRPALPASPEQLAPDGTWLFRLHQDLVGLRRRCPWLVRGRVEVLERQNRRIRYRTSGGGHAMEVELALDPPAVRIAVDGDTALRWPAR